MDNTKAALLGGSRGSAGPKDSTEPQRSIVWVRRRGQVVKVVEGADPAEIERITDLALVAAGRLSASASTGVAAPRRDAVPTSQRITDLLTTAGPLTGREIAERLAVPVATVSKALQRGAGSQVVMRASVEGPATWAVREDVADRYLDIVSDR